MGSLKCRFFLTDWQKVKKAAETSYFSNAFRQ